MIKAKSPGYEYSGHFPTAVSQVVQTILSSEIFIYITNFNIRICFSHNFY